ncbi:MAG: NAD-dependent epimerase/dehydratase family protein [Candidatus Omnitrophota bacterium]|jgi:farnesol dehydrogenase|nr:MAG: NAD-dependent epimerase/dehydratase family protein [Candidatus Omnitrophota bacterium]
MKILITGATGYLGAAIVCEALDRGYAVKALGRIPRDQTTIPASVEYVQGDILDVSSLKKAVSGCEAVIHSAGLVSIWEKDPTRFHQINVVGTENLLRAACDQNHLRIVYTSSFFALGPTQERPVNESWNNTHLYKATEYATSKTIALKHVKERLLQGDDIVIAYPCLIYGPGKATQGNHITKMIDDFVHRRLPGVPKPGTYRWTYSYVDDVARGHLLALEKGKKGEGYIFGGEDASLLEFLELLEQLTGVKRPRRRIPLSLLKGVAWFEELRANLSNTHLPKITKDVVEVYNHHWRYSSNKAIVELGYTRTPLKMGLIKTLESLGFTVKEDW